MSSPKRAGLFAAWTVFLLLAPSDRLIAQRTAATKPTLPLWKVQGKSNAVYLLGSIHFCKSDFYPLAKPIEAAYQRAQVVVFETDIDKMSSPELQMKLLTQGMYPAGETLQQHVSKQTYAALQTRLKNTLGQESAFDRFKPWMAAVSLVALELQKLGFDPEQGIDKHFFRKTQSDKKHVVPLETIEFQMSLFTGLAKGDQESLLKSTLEDVGRYPQIFDDVVAAWKTGDLKELEKLFLEITREYPAIYKKFVTDRNRAWLPKIEGLLQGGKDAFVVVGMGHLVGKDSVVDLLAKKGIKVEQQ